MSLAEERRVVLLRVGDVVEHRRCRSRAFVLLLLGRRVDLEGTSDDVEHNVELGTFGLRPNSLVAQTCVKLKLLLWQ